MNRYYDRQYDLQIKQHSMNMLSVVKFSLFLLVIAAGLFFSGCESKKVKLETAGAQTGTPIPTSTNPQVPTPTNTPIPTSTNTPIPTSTDTPIPTSTSTPVPTPTNAPIQTPTSTPIPTDTFVPTSTNTPVPTDTPVPVASKLEVKLTHSKGSDVNKLCDGNYKTIVGFASGYSLTIRAEEPIGGIYIAWSVSQTPKNWTIEAGGEVTAGRETGFLHDYVEICTKTNEVTLRFKDSATVAMAEIEVYGEGRVPENVQVWEPSLKEADFLVFSTHADDEVLFLGGVLTEYAGNRGYSAQVVYLCDFTLDDYGYRNIIREHEKLDGLWEMGVKNYPVNGFSDEGYSKNLQFPDAYSTEMETALKQYDYNEVLEFVVGNIRRFKPLVVVTHDFDGEYGHGAHMMLAKAVSEALVYAADEYSFTESQEKYGAWNTPKAYFHLYEEGTIRLNLREPLETFGNRTALEVLEAAYKKHVTQQSAWFFVSDEDKRMDCAAFGLYRSEVGADVEGDMMENVRGCDGYDRH